MGRKFTRLEAGTLITIDRQLYITCLGDPRRLKRPALLVQRFQLEKLVDGASTY